MKVEVAVPRPTRPRDDVEAIQVSSRRGVHTRSSNRSTFAEDEDVLEHAEQDGFCAPGQMPRVLTLHVGPMPALSALSSAQKREPSASGEDELWGLRPQVHEVLVNAEETKTVAVPLPSGVGWVPICVQASLSLQAG